MTAPSGKRPGLREKTGSKGENGVTKGENGVRSKYLTFARTADLDALLPSILDKAFKGEL
jgi:hypothetical protein